MEFRYKKPGDSQSRLLSIPMDNSRTAFISSTENMRFAASVAGLGLLLKDSEYKGNLSFDDVRQWGNGARSYDPYGFREEYIQLIEKLMKLD